MTAKCQTIKRKKKQEKTKIHVEILEGRYFSLHVDSDHVQIYWFTMGFYCISTTAVNGMSLSSLTSSYEANQNITQNKL